MKISHMKRVFIDEDVLGLIINRPWHLNIIQTSNYWHHMHHVLVQWLFLVLTLLILTTIVK